MQADLEIIKKLEEIHSVLKLDELPETFNRVKQAIVGDILITMVYIAENHNYVEVFYSDHGQELAEYTAWEYIQPYDYLTSKSITSFFGSIKLPWNEKRSAAGVMLLRFRETVFGYALIGDEQTKISDELAVLLELLLSEFSNVYIRTKLLEETNNDAQLFEQKLNVLSSMGDVLATLEMKPLLSRTASLGVRIIGCEVASIWLYNSKNNKLESKIEWGLSEDIVGGIKFSNGERLVDYVFRTNEPFLINNFQNSEEIDAMPTSVEINSIIAVPLKTKLRKLGVFTLVNSTNDEEFQEKDLELLNSISLLASIAIDNSLLYEESLDTQRLENDMRVAQKIQHDFWPKFAPKVENLAIAGKCWSCDQTGGDYYDFLEFKRNGKKLTAIAIGDVSGHGVGSALIMSYAKALLQALKTTNNSIADILALMNQALFEVTQPDMFMTFLLAFYDSENRTLTYASAGHDMPIIYRASGEIEELPPTGPPLGLFLENVKWDIAEPIKLNKGDTVFFFTDGVWEARNLARKSFGRHKLTELIKTIVHDEPAQIIKTIYKEVRTYTAPLSLQDDFTAIVCKAI